MRILRNISLFFCLPLFASCSLQQQEATSLHRDAKVFPEYNDVTMPCNIAAPTFALVDSTENLTDVQAVFRAGEKDFVVGSDGEKGICIDNEDWRELCASAKDVSVTIQGKKDGSWVEYNAFNIHISPDSIDNFIAYRLIEPGYEVWNKMGIYQRNVTNYEEKAILTNDDNNGGCMNCHSFCNRDARKMSLHLRLECGGTYITKDGRTQKLSPTPSLVYPSWHPGGRYIAYSQNVTKQHFHTSDRNRIEVMDFKSDVVVLDTETGETITCDLLHSDDVFETFPSWSADGKTLYYCAADSVEIPKDYDKAKYSLCSIAFDADSGTFGSAVDTLYSAKTKGGSVSFPRESPDGRWLMFTLSEYGNFSIWHKSADLWMLPVSKNETSTQHPTPNTDLPLGGMRGAPSPITQLNSADVDSYHTWSSTGRWVVFSSRRDDGLYTRLYIAHCDKDGNFTIPFELPQPDAEYYQRLMKSYNVPEFTINAFEDTKALKDAIQ